MENVALRSQTATSLLPPHTAKLQMKRAEAAFLAKACDGLSNKSPQSDHAVSELAMAYGQGTGTDKATKAVAQAVSAYQALGANYDGARLLTAALTGVETPSDDVIATIQRLLPSLGSIADNVRSVPVAGGADAVALREAAQAAGTNAALPPQARAAYVAGADGSEGTILLADNLSGEDLESAATEEVGQALARRALLKGIEPAPGDVGARFRAALSGVFLNPQNNPAAYDPKPSDGGEVLLEGKIVEARFQPPGRQEAISAAYGSRLDEDSGYFLERMERADASGDQLMTPEIGRTLLRMIFVVTWLESGAIRNLGGISNVVVTRQNLDNFFPRNAFRETMQSITNFRLGREQDEVVTEQQMAATLNWMGVDNIGFFDGRYLVQFGVELPRDTPVNVQGNQFFGTNVDGDAATAYVNATPLQLDPSGDVAGSDTGIYDYVIGVLQNPGLLFDDEDEPTIIGQAAEDAQAPINDVIANANAGGPISNIATTIYYNDDGVDLLRAAANAPQNPPTFADINYLPEFEPGSEDDESDVVAAPTNATFGGNFDFLPGGTCAINPSNSTCP